MSEFDKDSSGVKVLPMEKLPEVLQNCDYVCNLLPKTSKTTGILDSNMLANCKGMYLSALEGSLN